MVLNRRTFAGALLASGSAFAWPPIGRAWDNPYPYQDHSDLIYYLDSSGQRQPVTDVAGWRRRYRHILHNAQAVMGPLRSHLINPKIRTAGPEDMGTYTRTKLWLKSEPWDEVPAYLLRPKAPLGVPGPAMICLHQTNNFGKAEPVGIAGLPQLRYALELTQRGYVTLSPDYPYFGEYSVDLYDYGQYLSATMKGIVNHQTAYEFLSSLPDVDPERIGVIGHSLGAQNSLFAAMFETRLKVVVESCGFTAFPVDHGGDLSGWGSVFYMPRITTAYGNSPARVPFDFPEVLGLIAPRPLFISAAQDDAGADVNGVRSCVASVTRLYDQVFHNTERLTTIYPPGPHDFPDDARAAAYRFIDNWL